MASCNPAENTRSALVMVGGAGGVIHGPVNSYEELATRLQAEGIAALRLEYRKPNYLEACVYDVLAGIAALDQQGINRVALLGWSFGGAVVISAGAVCDASVGVATVASQTYGTGAVGKLSPKSLLLIHGTADQVLPYYLSEDLYERADEPKELVFYLEDGHGIERHRSEMLEKLYSWSSDLLLIKEGTDGVQSRVQADPAGDTMDFNPEDAQKYSEDADYPASKEDLISTAKSNGAPEDLIERIGTLGRTEFSEPDDVVAELRASPHPT